MPNRGFLVDQPGRRTKPLNWVCPSSSNRTSGKLKCI